MRPVTRRSSRSWDSSTCSLNPPLMPVATEIYILPTGEVVIADMPAELAAAIQPWAPSDPAPDQPDAKEPPHGR